MRLTINGEAREVDGQISVAELLEEIEQDVAGVAIAINRNITPQAEWLTTLLNEGDEVVLFRAIAGG